MRSLVSLTTRLILTASVGLLVTGIAACGGDDDAPSATATSATAASSTQVKAAYPVKVTDLLGREVEIKAAPKTIVALSPTAVEYVYAVGGTVAGRPSSANFPQAAQSAKEVGTAYKPSFETILAMKPDLIVADSVIHAQPQLRKPIEDLGIPVIFAGADSYQKVLDGLSLMGKVLDAQEKAKAAILGVTKARDDAKAALAGKKVVAVVLIADRDNTLYSAKANSYAGDVLTQLGITNAFADGPESGPGFPGYTTVAPEKLVQVDPNIIFTVTPGPASAPRLSTLIPQIPPFKGLKAVANKKVVELDVDQLVQAPGPRIVLAFQAVATAAAAP